MPRGSNNTRLAYELAVIPVVRFNTPESRMVQPLL